MKLIMRFIYSLLLATLICGSSGAQTIRLFAGCYNEKGGKDFSVFDLNREQGTFKLISDIDAGPNPSYFCISRKNPYIYAANEVMKFNGMNAGGITTLKYNDKTGTVEKAGELVVPFGGPCFISLSPEEDYLLMANYSSSSISVVRLGKTGLPERVTDTIAFKGNKGQTSHPHMIAFDPAGKRVYLTDLGLDRVVIFNLDHSTGKLHQIVNGVVYLSKGAGPRHFVFNADGTRMYVICELNSTISVFNVSPGGELKPVQTLSTLPENLKIENACADVHIGNSGNYLYGSNRGENTIVTYRIGNSGTLIYEGRTRSGGNWPRNFVIDPSGKFIIAANERSGDLVLFRIDEKSGLPVPTGATFKINSPVCLKFLPQI